MKVFTSRPILVNPETTYSNVSGSSSLEMITLTQKVINQLIMLGNALKPMSAWTPPIPENGLWDETTSKAYESRKSQVDAEIERLTEQRIKTLNQKQREANAKLLMAQQSLKQAKTASEKQKAEAEVALRTSQAEAQAKYEESEKAKAEAEAKAKAEAEASWWSKRTKTQKGLIIGGGVAILGLTIFLIVRAQKNRKTAVTV